jgi:type IV secretory pathway VirB10-like protein
MTDKNNDLGLAADPKESPDFLAAPKKGKGVRRLNRVPLLVVGGLITLAVLGITYTFFQRQAANTAGPAKAPEAPPVETPAMAPVRPVGPDYVAPTPPPAEPPSMPTEAPTEAPVQQGAVGSPAAPSEAYQRRMQLIERIEEKRLAQLEAALGSDASVQTFKLDQPAANGGQQAASGTAGMLDPMQQYMAAAGMLPAASGMMGGMMGGNGGSPDPNQQAAKRAFLSGTAEADTYLAHTRQAGISPAQEVKAGTIIPGVLISGVNSDLPGQIIGQVREDVYDSATGQNLLIPAGARLIGTYDNGVTLGQTRALVAWTRIIYPDGSSLSLNMMPGADQSGYAGFHDKVNNHYWRIFGNGLMLSLFSAGIQLSQPQKNTGYGYDSQQIIAAELGRQMGQLGMEMTRRNMDIQPTLEIRPGYRFNVMVTKDILLPTWSRGAPQ